MKTKSLIRFIISISIPQKPCLELILSNKVSGDL